MVGEASARGVVMKYGVPLVAIVQLLIGLGQKLRIWAEHNPALSGLVRSRRKVASRIPLPRP